MAIKLNVQTSKIEFDFAGLLVIADVRDENIKNLLKLKNSDLQEEASKAAKEVEKMDEDEITAEDFERMYSLCADLYGRIYEPVFGEHSFVTVYNHIGSIQSTIIAFDEAIDYVVADINKRNEQGAKEREKTLAKYKKRKAK